MALSCGCMACMRFCERVLAAVMRPENHFDDDGDGDDGPAVAQPAGIMQAVHAESRSTLEKKPK